MGYGPHILCFSDEKTDLVAHSEEKLWTMDLCLNTPVVLVSPAIFSHRRHRTGQVRLSGKLIVLLPSLLLIFLAADLIRRFLLVTITGGALPAHILGQTLLHR